MKYEPDDPFPDDQEKRESRCLIFKTSILIFVGRGEDMAVSY